MQKRRRGGGGEPPKGGEGDAEAPAAAEGKRPRSIERAMSRFAQAVGPEAEADGGLEAAPVADGADEQATIERFGADRGDRGEEVAPISIRSAPGGPTAVAGAPGSAAASTATAATASAPAASAGTPAGERAQTPIVELGVDRLRATGLMPPENEARRIEDQFRRIKRPLLANAFGINVPRLNNGNLIMVASSLPAEGKSFTSFNLALSIANELDRTVLLVDADVAKPHMTRALGLHERQGLIDLLLERDLDPQDVILRTSVPGMRLLPSGSRHRHATELLASERMAALVEELASRYPDRVIIFDTPPLIPTTEAQAMAHLMGQIVVVVHAGHTPQNAVLQALETLRGSGEISLVLNKTRTAWGEEYGRYAYYEH